jgi:hypothetical protein
MGIIVENKIEVLNQIDALKKASQIIYNDIIENKISDRDIEISDLIVKLAKGILENIKKAHRL